MKSKENTYLIYRIRTRVKTMSWILGKLVKCERMKKPKIRVFAKQGMNVQ